MKTILISGAIIFALDVAALAATNGYLSPAGTDVGTCATTGSPCLTINYFASKVLRNQPNPGGTLTLMCGTYTFASEPYHPGTLYIPISGADGSEFTVAGQTGCATNALGTNTPMIAATGGDLPDLIAIGQGTHNVVVKHLAATTTSPTANISGFGLMHTGTAHSADHVRAYDIQIYNVPKCGFCGNMGDHIWLDSGYVFFSSYASSGSAISAWAPIQSGTTQTEDSGWTASILNVTNSYTFANGEWSVQGGSDDTDGDAVIADTYEGSNTGRTTTAPVELCPGGVATYVYNSGFLYSGGKGVHTYDSSCSKYRQVVTYSDVMDLHLTGQWSIGGLEVHGSGGNSRVGGLTVLSSIAVATRSTEHPCSQDATLYWSDSWSTSVGWNTADGSSTTNANGAGCTIEDPKINAETGTLDDDFVDDVRVSLASGSSTVTVSDGSRLRNGMAFTCATAACPFGVWVQNLNGNTFSMTNILGATVNAIGNVSSGEAHFAYPVTVAVVKAAAQLQPSSPLLGTGIGIQ